MIFQVEILQQLQLVSYFGSFVTYGILAVVAFRVYTHTKIIHAATLGLSVACLLVGSVVDAAARYLPPGSTPVAWLVLCLGGTLFFGGSYLLIYSIVRPAGKSTRWRLMVYALIYTSIIVLHWFPGVILPFYDATYQYWFYDASIDLFWLLYTLTLLPIIDVIYLAICRTRKGVSARQDRIAATLLWFGILAPIIGQIVYALDATQRGYLLSNFTLLLGMAFFALHYLVNPRFFTILALENGVQD